MARLEYYVPDNDFDCVDPDWLNPNFDWSGFHTRMLLDMRIAYRDHPVLHPILKRVLATREHIPNKQESKVIRQQRAKAQRNR